MDGWIDGLMDGWVDRWMDEYMDVWVDGWVDGWMSKWMCDVPLLLMDLWIEKALSFDDALRTTLSLSDYDDDETC